MAVSSFDHVLKEEGWLICCSSGCVGNDEHIALRLEYLKRMSGVKADGVR